MDIKILEAVSKDIINIKFDVNMSMVDAVKCFYAVMEKYNIKRMTAYSDGTHSSDNFEWTICRVLFIDRFTSYLDLEMILNFNGEIQVPVDLMFKRGD